MQAVEVNNVIDFAEKKESNISQLKQQLADAQARKAAMAAQSRGMSESQLQTSGGGGESMTPRDAAATGDGAVMPAPTPASSSRPPATWNTDELCSWLDGTMNVASISTAAKAEEVDGATAVEMDNDAWKELGASALKAAKIVAALKKLG